MLKVMRDKCVECLFSENRIVRPGRMADIIKDCRKTDNHFICHKATLKNTEAVCRGFYDTQTSQMIRIAGRLNAIEFVEEKDL